MTRYTVTSAPLKRVGPLSFDTDQRFEPGDGSRKTGTIRGFDDLAHILIGSRRFFRYTALGAAADEHAASREGFDNFLAAPVPEGLMPAHGPAGAMAGRAEGDLHPF